MGRLTSIKPNLSSLSPRLGYAPGDDKARDKQRYQQQAWRAWYNTKRWRQLRWAVLLRDLFTCQMCGRPEADTSQLVADHKTPHRGDEALFWDEGNLWTLCKTCHDGAKQREENARR